MEELETVYARTGSAEGASDQAEDVIGTIQIEFIDWDQRRTADEIFVEIRERTADLAGIIVEPRKQESGPPGGKAIQIEIGSRYPELIEPVVAQVREKLDTINGLIDIEDSRPLPGIEWEIEIDRAQAAKFGADVQLLGSTIQLVTNGLLLSTYRPDGSRDEIDIRARFPVDWRTLDMLDRLRIQTDQGLVPIGNFVTRTAHQKVGTIERVDSQRVMTLLADVAPGVLADAKVREIRAWVDEQAFDSRIDIAFKGEDEDQKNAQAFLMKAFSVALFMMAIILVTQFNSFYSAFLILSAVVMSTVGVMIGLLVTGQPFGIVMSGIGVIALAGIVVNNNIVLIDTFDRIAATTDDMMDAILRTGAQRLRPVLLTTVTTILGLMPMVLSTNIDFFTRNISVGAPSTQWWTQLATAIVFGLAFATMLTLIVTPSALMARANVRAWRQRRRDKRTARRIARGGNPQAAE